MAFLDEHGLVTLWAKIKDKFSLKTHTHTAAEVGALASSGTAVNASALGGVAASSYALKSEIPDGAVVDSALNSSSTNPVQNKAINSALGGCVTQVSGSMNCYFPDIETSNPSGWSNAAVVGPVIFIGGAGLGGTTVAEAAPSIQQSSPQFTNSTEARHLTGTASGVPEAYLYTPASNTTVCWVIDLNTAVDSTGNQLFAYSGTVSAENQRAQGLIKNHVIIIQDQGLPYVAGDKSVQFEFVESLGWAIKGTADFTYNSSDHTYSIALDITIFTPEAWTLASTPKLSLVATKVNGETDTHDINLSALITSSNVLPIVSSGGYVTSTYVSGATVSSATNAGVASKITTSTYGGAAQPVYISAGVPKAISYTISKSVPADAKFTDSSTLVISNSSGTQAYLLGTLFGGFSSSIIGGLAYKSTIYTSGDAIYATTFSGTATNASSLGGIAAGNYVRTDNVNQTISGAKTFTSKVEAPNIEFTGGSTNGGYIDFHYGKSTSDYTTRIIEQASGELGIKGALAVAGNIHQKPDTSGTAAVFVDNGYTNAVAHKVSLQANGSGNAGVYDHTNSRWLLICNSANNLYLGELAPGVTINGGGYFYAKADTFSKGQTPSGNVYCGEFWANDANGTGIANRLGGYQVFVNSDGAICNEISTKQNISGSTGDGIRLRLWYDDTTSRALATLNRHPPTTDNEYCIPTIGWMASNGAAKTAGTITSTLPISNGGTGATTRLNAFKALTQENVGTNADYFITITASWANAGYTKVDDAKTVLGIDNCVKCDGTGASILYHWFRTTGNAGRMLICRGRTQCTKNAVKAVTFPKAFASGVTPVVVATASPSDTPAVQTAITTYQFDVSDRTNTGFNVLCRQNGSTTNPANYFCWIAFGLAPNS